MKLDNAKVNEIRTKLEMLLNGFDEPGIVLKLGNGTYNPNGSATFKVEVGTVADNGLTMDKAATDFIRYAGMLGMKTGDLGREVLVCGRTYKLVGYKPRGVKCVLELNGVRFQLPVGKVKLLLASTPQVG